MKLLYFSILILICFSACQKGFTIPDEGHTCTPVSDTTVVSSTFYPCSSRWGMLAFEDKWPELNDYDMNDLIVSYQYELGKNTNGKVLSMDCRFTINAVGANYANGLAIQFPFASSLVKSVTGQSLADNFIQLQANGTESGLTNTVVFPFDDTRNLIQNKNSALPFINVYPDMEKAKSDTVTVHIRFASAIDEAQIGTAPYDPFLIANMRRSREVHLPGKTPTGKADMSFFNKNDDASKNGVTYETAGKLPWAIHVPDGNYKYPIDGRKLTDTYLHFGDWAASSGTLFTDWLTNSSADYVKTSNLYH